MTNRRYQVRFTRSSIGAEQPATTLATKFQLFLDTHGAHAPTQNIDGYDWQIRDLHKYGTVWRGVFARLRHDAPHILDSADQELELALEEGDRILDKVFFLYYTDPNVLVWQYDKNVTGLSRFQHYLYNSLREAVELPLIIDRQALDNILNRNIYELQFTYDRPPATQARAAWEQSAFDMMSSIHGAIGKFVIRGERQASLGGHVRSMLRSMVNSTHMKSIRVKFTDEPSELVDLLLAPIKDHIVVPLQGRYPVTARVYEELAEAFSRQVHRFPQA